MKQLFSIPAVLAGLAMPAVAGSAVSNAVAPHFAADNAQAEARVLPRGSGGHSPEAVRILNQLASEEKGNERQLNAAPRIVTFSSKQIGGSPVDLPEIRLLTAGNTP